MKRVRLGSLLAISLTLWVGSASAQTDPVRAILFFSPTCPHCHEVIRDHLPLLFQTHGGVPQTQLAWGASQEEVAVYYVSNGQIELLLIDVAVAAGSDLYNACTEAFSIPRGRRGVPRLVIGDTVLVGSLEIPTHFPRLVEEGLRAGGIDWPSIPGLTSVVAAFAGKPERVAEATAEDSVAEAGARAHAGAEDVAVEDSAAAAGEAGALSEADTAAQTPESPSAAEPEREADRVATEAMEPGPTGGEPEPRPAATSAAGADSVPTPAMEDAVSDADRAGRADADAPQPTIFDRLPERRATLMENFRSDPAGNTMSVVVLIGMLLCVLAVLALPRLWSGRETLSPLALVAALFGIGVAGYLAYIETTGSLAVCGPVGDCNTVQQSAYARLFGLIPVGVLGAVGYVLIVAAWWLSRSRATRASDVAKVVILVISFTGTLFSIYLTFLEPFVIGATCAWCLTSSLLITALMVLSIGPGVSAWARLRSS